MHGHMDVKVTLFIEDKLNRGCNMFRHLVCRGTYQVESMESVFNQKAFVRPGQKGGNFSGMSQATIPYRLYQSFEIKTRQAKCV
jgi:hypothetical protein